nr:hypothetical protein [Chloroflexota bacterium]
MSLFSIWPQFGFRENPYSNRNLPGDEVGNELFVGRTVEVNEVQRKIASEGTHPSVEGLAGVGKSSMVAVASYRMMKASVEARDGTLYLPLPRFFQATESAEALEQEVYYEIAQALIGNVQAFRESRLEVPDIGSLDRWLNSPQYQQFSGGLPQLSFGYGTSVNDAEGFADSGFVASVRA